MKEDQLKQMSNEEMARHGASGMCCQLRLQEKARADELEKRVRELQEALNNHCGCTHDGRGNLIAECQQHREEREAYDTLVGLLKKRFPQRADGSLPDFAIEDVLTENERLRQRNVADLESDSIVGSCNCLTKSPDVQYHKPGCKYRLISERDQLREKLAIAATDMKRLDWLLKPAGNQSIGVAEIESVKGSAVWHFTRAAIDAAMQAQTTKE